MKQVQGASLRALLHVITKQFHLDSRSDNEDTKGITINDPSTLYLTFFQLNS